VDSVSEVGWFIEGESGGQKRSVIQQPDQVLDGLVALIFVTLGFQFLDDGVVWVDFHSFLGDHISTHGGISQSLSFHDSFHIGRPTVLSGDQDTWGVF